LGGATIELQIRHANPTHPDWLNAAIRVSEAGLETFPGRRDDGAFVLPVGKTLLVRTSSGKTVSVELRGIES
jgi:hypothetical protein